MKKVLGLDPGVTTGVALLWYLDDGTFDVFETGQFRDINSGQMMRTLQDLYSRADDIVIEAFVGSGARDRNINQTLETVGYLKALAYARGLPPVMHIPSARKPFLDMASQLLKASVKGKDRHSVDAAAHAIGHCIKPKMGVFRGHK